MSSTPVKVSFVSETKSFKFKSLDLINRFPIVQSIVAPANGSGGLWFYGMTTSTLCFRSTPSMILGYIVNTSNGEAFALDYMYGDSNHCNSSSLWQEVVGFANDKHGRHFFCMGALHDLMYFHEKMTIMFIIIISNLFALLLRNAV